VSRPGARRPFTLAVDIGGSGLKAAVLDAQGRLASSPRRVATPRRRCTPAVLLNALDELIAPLPRFDRASVGFPGVVRDSRLITAGPFTRDFPPRFPLARALARRWGKPVRVLNDADMQGLAAVRGRGLALVVTLGTGMGTALFLDGTLLPHLELAQHPCHRGWTYDHLVGDKVLERLGRRAWNRRVRHALEMLRVLVHYDHLYVGGGNAKKLTFTLPHMRRVSNQAGILGGIALWRGPGLSARRRGGGRRRASARPAPRGRRRPPAPSRRRPGRAARRPASARRRT
jgi:polyphosphate glucokinase